MPAKLQIFIIHTHSCFYKERKCYSVGTYPLNGQGCDKFYTEQTGITNSTINSSLSALWRHMVEERYSSIPTSGLDWCQWLISHPTQFNPGKEARYPRACLVIVEKRKIFVPTTIWTLNHPDNAKKTLYTPWIPKYYPTTGHHAWPDLEGNPAPAVQEAAWAIQPVWTAAENLVPTPGFNPQTI
jgi:hypothetical protein